ncbi:MAG: ATP synthase F0 subunit C [Phycisphaera sp.]|nr:ATP synthase F0 subunit C [Phycisphaera sp.]
MLDLFLTLAQAAASSPVGLVGIGIGMGLVVVGAGIGIGRIGGDACAGISRQPEAAGKISTNMIIAAALVEGLAFFAVIMIFLSKSI